MTDLDPGADLRGRLDHATTGLSAPAGLTESVLTDGRRLRRRRRILGVATGTAAAAVAAALVAVSLGGGTTTANPGFATEPSAPHQGSTAGAPISGEPSTWNGEGSPFPEARPGWWDAPGHLLATQLQVGLPDGVSVTRSEEQTGGLLAELDSPTGPGGFQLILYPPEPDEVPDPVTTTDAAGNEHTSAYADSRSHRSRTRCDLVGPPGTCAVIHDADGARIGRVNSFPQDRVTFYEATLLGPDGGLVYLSVWNATDEKPGPDTPASAEVPPLTLDQLRDLVQDPVWTSYRP
jgi:hypothetical protein